MEHAEIKALLDAAAESAVESKMGRFATDMAVLKQTVSSHDIAFHEVSEIAKTLIRVDGRLASMEKGQSSMETSLQQILSKPSRRLDLIVTVIITAALTTAMSILITTLR